MKAALGLAGALWLIQSARPMLAAPGFLSLSCAPEWKRIREVELQNAGTDNGGEMQVFGLGASRKVRVVIGLSNATVQTDYTFRRSKLVLVDRTRTRFALGEEGIDFTKPNWEQNGRYGFRDGKVISRVTRERSAGGRWKYGVAPIDKMNARHELENARFYLHVAASGKKQVDVEQWLRRAK